MCPYRWSVSDSRNYLKNVSQNVVVLKYLFMERKHSETPLMALMASHPSMVIQAWDPLTMEIQPAFLCAVNNLKREKIRKMPVYYTVSFKRLYQLRFLTIELWKDATGARRHWTGWIRGMTKQPTCWKRNFHQEFRMARGHRWFQSCDDHTSMSHQRQKVVALWILLGGVWNPEISEIFLSNHWKGLGTTSQAMKRS